MVRLIDANKLRECIALWRMTIAYAYGESDEYVKCLEFVIQTIDEAETVDPAKEKEEAKRMGADDFYGERGQGEVTRSIDANKLLVRLGMAEKCGECRNRMPLGFCGLGPDLEQVCDAIASAPTFGGTATLAGEWTTREDPDYLGGGYVKCSVCGHGFAVGAFAEVTQFRFCPWCGARMNNE